MGFLTFLTKNLCRRRARSSLTCAGLAIAVGTTVALLGISDGFERSTVESFESRGVDIVVVADGVLDQLSSDLDERAADLIRDLAAVRRKCRALTTLWTAGQSFKVCTIGVDNIDIVASVAIGIKGKLVSGFSGP